MLRVSRLVGCAVVALGCALPGAASASPGAGPTAVVSLGDSFISGEAGRWAGNSVVPLGDRAGTDRAWVRGDVVRPSGKDAVYPGGTDADGCHRSDVAPVHSALRSGAPFAVSINLACSGAETADIVSAGQKGYPPQVAQLAGVAGTHDVKMVVLSIGGNDLGFADIIVNCVISWVGAGAGVLPTSCNGTEQPKVDAAFPAAMAGVGASLDAIRSTMAAAGYAPSDYRLVLQSYPSPVPRAAELRYAPPLRLVPGSCPMTNADADWARGSLVNQIADGLSAVALDRGVEFLDLRSLFDGHEACSSGSRQATALAPVTSVNGEWVRFVDVGQHGGETQESFHPNAFGQQAMGACWAAVAASVPGRFVCTNISGTPATNVALARTGELPVPVPEPEPVPAPSPAPAAPAPVAGSGSSTDAVPGAQPAGASKPSRSDRRARARAKRKLERQLARCGRKDTKRARKACKRAARKAYRRST